MKLVIAANWKMHKTGREAKEFCLELLQKEDDYKGVEVLICPPFTALSAAAAELKDSSVKLGAQNLYPGAQGAFTGEISAAMLKEAGVKYVIIGHSERRHLMGEDDSLVARKIEAAYENGLNPILCIGEKEEEREKGITEKVLKKQLAAALEKLEPGQVKSLVIAYEPVWAIGTGKAASADDAASAADFIYSYLDKHFGKDAAAGVRIQYGGSVKAENIGSFVTLEHVHGALVGGASLEAGSFSELVRAARKAVEG